MSNIVASELERVTADQPTAEDDEFDPEADEVDHLNRAHGDGHRHARVGRAAQRRHARDLPAVEELEERRHEQQLHADRHDRRVRRVEADEEVRDRDEHERARRHERADHDVRGEHGTPHRARARRADVLAHADAAAHARAERDHERGRRDVDRDLVRRQLRRDGPKQDRHYVLADLKSKRSRRDIPLPAFAVEAHLGACLIASVVVGKGDVNRYVVDAIRAAAEKYRRTSLSLAA
jgi:hypothetical protein